MTLTGLDDYPLPTFPEVEAETLAAHSAYKEHLAQPVTPLDVVALRADFDKLEGEQESGADPVDDSATPTRGDSNEEPTTDAVDTPTTVGAVGAVSATVAEPPPNVSSQLDSPDVEGATAEAATHANATVPSDSATLNTLLATLEVTRQRIAQEDAADPEPVSDTGPYSLQAMRTTVEHLRQEVRKARYTYWAVLGVVGTLLGGGLVLSFVPAIAISGLTQVPRALVMLVVGGVIAGSCLLVARKVQIASEVGREPQTIRYFQKLAEATARFRFRTDKPDQEQAAEMTAWMQTWHRDRCDGTIPEEAEFQRKIFFLGLVGFTLCLATANFWWMWEHRTFNVIACTIAALVPFGSVIIATLGLSTTSLDLPTDAELGVAEAVAQQEAALQAWLSRRQRRQAELTRQEFAVEAERTHQQELRAQTTTAELERKDKESARDFSLKQRQLVHEQELTKSQVEAQAAVMQSAKAAQEVREKEARNHRWTKFVSEAKRSHELRLQEWETMRRRLFDALANAATKYERHRGFSRAELDRMEDDYRVLKWGTRGLLLGTILLVSLATFPAAHFTSSFIGISYFYLNEVNLSIPTYPWAFFFLAFIFVERLLADTLADRRRWYYRSHVLEGTYNEDERYLGHTYEIRSEAQTSDALRRNIWYIGILGAAFLLEMGLNLGWFFLNGGESLVAGLFAVLPSLVMVALAVYHSHTRYRLVWLKRALGEGGRHKTRRGTPTADRLLKRTATSATLLAEQEGIGPLNPN